MTALALAASACGDPNTPELGAFAVVARFTVARHYPAIAQLHDGRILIAGGATADGTVLASAEIFNPADHSVTAVRCELQTARRHSVAVTLIDGRVLIIGGNARSLVMLAQTELYDPVDDCFSPGPQLRERRDAVIAALPLPNGEIFVLLGAPVPPDSTDGGAEIIAEDLRTIRVVDRDLGEWTERQGVAVLADGRVLLAGGTIAVGNFVGLSDRMLVCEPGEAACELLPVTLDEPASLKTVIATPDGGALIIGGGAGFAIQAVERFEPDGSLRVTGMLAQPRSLASAVSIGDRVLVIGGIHRFGQPPHATTEWLSWEGESLGPGPDLAEGVASDHRSFVFDGAVYVVRPAGDPAGDTTTSIQVNPIR